MTGTALMVRPPEAVEGEIVGAGLFLEANPFKRGSFQWLDVEEGSNLESYYRAACAALPPVYAPHVELWIDEARVERKYWSAVKPKPGHTIFARVRPHGSGGGKNILRAVLMIAVVVAISVALGPGGIFGAAGLSGALGGGAIGSALASLAVAAVTTVAMLAINALIPAPGLTGEYIRGPKYRLTGSSNQNDPYGPIPRVFGQTRLYPVIAGSPYTEIEGIHQFLRMLLLVGWGPLDISDIRIGETPITAYADVQYEVNAGGPTGWGGTNTPITLYTTKVSEQSLQIQLLNGVPGAFQTTSPNCIEIGVDVTFPSGLIQFNTDGSTSTASCIVQVQYRVAGSNSAWTNAPLETAYQDANYWSDNSTGDLHITDSSQSAVIMTGRFKVAAGKYEVQCVRLTNDHNTYTSGTPNVIDTSYWTAIRSFCSDQPVVQDSVAVIAIRMRATNQLNGVPNQISCLAKAYTQDINNPTAAWTLSRSPARAFCDVLRRRGSETRIADSRIDLASLSAWDTACNATAPNASEPRWTYDGVIEGGSVYDALRQIAGIGRAAYTMKDGKFGVVQDVSQATPVQMITPRNSWNYSGTRAYLDLPDAYRVQFQNSALEYKMDERIVYMDGMDQTNAKHIEVLQLDGCSSPTFAYREARYHMAVAHLRPEEHRVDMDIESLRATVGDRVQLAYDVMVVGLAWGRITSLITSGANTIGFVVDMQCTFAAGNTYVLRTRNSAGTQVVRTVTMTGGTGTTTTLNCAAETTAGGAAPGDLFVFGQSGIESAPMIVKKIEPTSDFVATITMTNYDESVYTADTGTIPAFSSYIGGTPAAGTPPPNPIVSVRGDNSTTSKTGNVVLQSLGVNIQNPSSNIPIAGNEVQYKSSYATNWIGDGVIHSPSQTTVMLGPVIPGVAYVVRARAKGTNGLYSGWVQPAQVAVIGPVTTPNPPTAPSVTPEYRSNIIRWTNPTNKDLEYVEIYASQTNSFSSATVVGEDITGTFTHQGLNGGASWYYWLVSVDFAGNVSANVYAGTGTALTIALYEGIGADGVLTPAEKQLIIKEWGSLGQEKAGIDAAATTFNVTTEKTNYDNAYNTLNTYLTGLSPAYSDTTQNTNIVRTTWNADWESLYSTRQALLNKIDSTAATMANWSTVTNDNGGLPENNATPGDNYQPDPNFNQQGTSSTSFSTIWNAQGRTYKTATP